VGSAVRRRIGGEEGPSEGYIVGVTVGWKVGASEGVSSDGTPVVSANVGMSEGAVVLGAMDGSPRTIGSDDVILVEGAAVRVLRSLCGAAVTVAQCGSATRASIVVTLASD